MDSYIERIEELYEMWSNTITVSNDPKGEIEIWPYGLITDIEVIKKEFNYLTQTVDDGDRFDPVVNAKRIIQINVAIDKAKIIDKGIEGRVYDFNQWKQMNIQNLIKDYGTDLSDDIIEDDYNNYISDEGSKLLDELLDIIRELNIV
jgi:hypothetical protein